MQQILNQQQMEELTGLIARKAGIHFRSTDQEAIEVTQDLVKAILKDYVIIKIEKDETNTTQSQAD
jgi:hypothetical protein